MSDWQTLLDLPDGADERAIKRAYAQRLRTTRPDDDPDAFQHLHQAYQAALAACAARAGTTPPADIPTQLPLPQPPSARIDPYAVAGELIALAMQGDVQALQHGLQQQPALWSLQHKPLIGHVLLATLADDAPAMPHEAFDVLCDCFGWDDALHGSDIHAREAIARRCAQGWLLSPAGAQALGAAYMRIHDTLLVPGADVLPSLRQPRPFWRNLLSTLQPARPREAISVLTVLDYWHDLRLPPGLDARQVAFWSRFARDGDAIHWLSGGLRALIAALVLGLLCGWGLYASWPLPPSSDGALDGTQRALLIFVIAVLLFPLLWLCTMLVRAFLRWQSIPEGADARLPWLRTAALPLAVFATLGAFHLALRSTPGVPVAALVAVIAASGVWLRTARQRFLQRCAPGGDDLSVGFAAISCLMIVPALVMALVYWWKDLHAHRGWRR